jgi:hypothetical protein
VQTSRNLTIRLGGSFCLIFHPVWCPYESIMIGTIVIKCNCVTVRIGKCLCDVCQIVLGLKQKDISSLFAFNSASVYGIREAPAKPECLKFNASKGVVGVALIYSKHRFVLKARIT